MIVLMEVIAMAKKAYYRALCGIERIKVLFPDDCANFWCVTSMKTFYPGHADWNTT